MSLPDVVTLSLCSILQSTAFGFVFLVLWLRNRQAPHYAAWAASSLLYGVALLGLGLALRSNEPLIMVLLTIIGLSNALPLAGALHLGGVRVRAWVFLPILAAPLGHALPIALEAAGVIGDRKSWLVVGEAIGLAVALAIPGLLLAFGPGSQASIGRRIAGCAMLGYLPAYALSILGEFVMMPGRELLALLGLLSDQVLLGVINLGLLTIPVEQIQRQLRDAALRDALTGCWNRAGLAGLVSTYLRADATVIALDVDYFKQVNDRHGHAAGDEVLVFIGEEGRLLAHVFGGQVARLGGDEFLILLPADSVDPAHFTALLQNRLGSRSMRGMGWSVSLGLSRVRRSDRSLDDAIARADAALYRAKAARCADPAAADQPDNVVDIQSRAAASSASR